MLTSFSILIFLNFRPPIHIPNSEEKTHVLQNEPTISMTTEISYYCNNFLILTIFKIDPKSSSAPINISLKNEPLYGFKSEGMHIYVHISFFKFNY